jgi:glycosyltransferase involved in cell wall biosynthesis
VIRLHGNELVNAGRRFRRALMARALRGASRLAAVSDELRDLAISLGAEAGKIAVIANGVDTALFFPRDRAQARRALGLDRNRSILLTAGRLIEAKGFQHIVRALHQLRKWGVNAELAIAGGPSRGLPSCERNLRELVVSLQLQESVRFLGWVPPQELAVWMSAADVFCLASRREGCPNVVIEALACGAPVVATDVGTVSQLVPNDRYGCVIPAGDTDALAGALKRALEQEWDRGAISKWGQRRSWSDAARDVRAQMLAAVDQEPEPSARILTWTSR